MAKTAYDASAIRHFSKEMQEYVDRLERMAKEIDKHKLDDLRCDHERSKERARSLLDKWFIDAELELSRQKMLRGLK